MEREAKLHVWSDPHRNLHPALMQKKKKTDEQTGRRGESGSEGASMNEVSDHVMTSHLGQKRSQWRKFEYFFFRILQIFLWRRGRREQRCFQVNLDVKIFTEGATDKLMPLSACLSSAFAVKRVGVDLCQVMFEVCSDKYTQTQRYTSRFRGTCVSTSAGLLCVFSLLGATRVHSGQEHLLSPWLDVLRPT